MDGFRELVGVFVGCDTATVVGVATRRWLLVQHCCDVVVVGEMVRMRLKEKSLSRARRWGHQAMPWEGAMVEVPVEMIAVASE